MAAIVTPIQQHQSGHLIIGYPLPIATKSRLHDYYKSSGVLKEVDANPTEEYDSGDGKENTQQNPIPEKMRLPTNDDPYSLKPTHHYDPSATMQNPTNSLPIGLGILKYQQMYKILMTLPSLLIYPVWIPH